MEYYSTIKRNKVWVDATAWINPENVMISEKSHLTKDHILLDSIHMKYSEQGNL